MENKDIDKVCEKIGYLKPENIISFKSFVNTIGKQGINFSNLMYEEDEIMSKLNKVLFLLKDTFLSQIRIILFASQLINLSNDTLDKIKNNVKIETTIIDDIKFFDYYNCKEDK